MSTDRYVLACGEEGELATGFDSRDRRRKGGFHVVHRAQGDGLELAIGGHGFDAGGPDLGGEIEGANDFAEEGGLLVLRFGEGYGDFGTEKGYGEAGKAGSGAEVEEGGFGSRWRAAKRLSPKWRRTISSGSRMAVRLVRAFHLRSRSR